MTDTSALSLARFSALTVEEIFFWRLKVGRTLSFGGERSEAAFGEVPSYTSLGKKKTHR